MIPMTEGKRRNVYAKRGRRISDKLKENKDCVGEVISCRKGKY